MKFKILNPIFEDYKVAPRNREDSYYSAWLRGEREEIKADPRKYFGVILKNNATSKLYCILNLIVLAAPEKTREKVTAPNPKYVGTDLRMALTDCTEGEQGRFKLGNTKVANIGMYEILDDKYSVINPDDDEITNEFIKVVDEYKKAKESVKQELEIRAGGMSDDDVKFENEIANMRNWVPTAHLSSLDCCTGYTSDELEAFNNWIRTHLKKVVVGGAWVGMLDYLPEFFPKSQYMIDAKFPTYNDRRTKRTYQTYCYFTDKDSPIPEFNYLLDDDKFCCSDNKLSAAIYNDVLVPMGRDFGEIINH